MHGVTDTCSFWHFCVGSLCELKDNNYVFNRMCNMSNHVCHLSQSLSHMFVHSSTKKKRPRQNHRPYQNYNMSENTMNVFFAEEQITATGLQELTKLIIYLNNPGTPFWPKLKSIWSHIIVYHFILLYMIVFYYILSDIILYCLYTYG